MIPPSGLGPVRSGPGRSTGPVPQSLALARSQRSAALALRIATSLARLLQARSRPADAAAVLAEARSRIAEGFDTPDWLDAAALADEFARELASERRRLPPSR